MTEAMTISAIDLTKKTSAIEQDCNIGEPYTGIPNTSGNIGLWTIFDTRYPNRYGDYGNKNYCGHSPIKKENVEIFKPKSRSFSYDYALMYIVNKEDEFDDSYFVVRIAKRGEYPGIDITRVLNRGHVALGEVEVSEEEISLYIRKGAYDNYWGLARELVRVQFEDLDDIEKHCIEMLRTNSAPDSFLELTRLINNEIDTDDNLHTDIVRPGSRWFTTRNCGERTKEIFGYMAKSLRYLYWSEHPHDLVRDSLECAYWMLRDNVNLYKDIQAIIANANVEEEQVSMYTAALMGYRPYRKLGLQDKTVWDLSAKKKLLDWLLAMCDKAALEKREAIYLLGEV